MVLRILPAIISIVVVYGCASQKAVEEAQASAEQAAQAAEAALAAANEARMAVDHTRTQVERMFQASQMPDQPEFEGEEYLVPNSEYVSRDEPRYRVWYGTNRELVDPSTPQHAFSEKDAEYLTYGRALVYVPRSHQFGETGSSWIVRKITRKDDRLKIENVEVMSGDDFRREMGYKLGTRASGKRTALVYIHGYNTDFNEAIIRAAQIGYDLKVEGITAVFSWPSSGSVFRYTADEATIQASEQYLEEFLLTIISNPAVEDVNVLAHSMGNRALMRVLDRLVENPSLPAKPINQIILAAPDVDVRIFRQLADNYPRLSTRATLYVSAEDKALGLSGWIHEFQRLGTAPPVTVIPDIDTIAVDEIDVSTLGHGYFADAEAMLYDIYQLLTADSEPDDRQRLRPSTTPHGERFWFFTQ